MTSATVGAMRWAERIVLVLVTAGMAWAAAAEGGGGRVLFVAAALIAAGLVGRAWVLGAVTTGEVIIVAVVLRAVAFPLLPSLSDDGYRYLWDGLLQVQGLNPFLHRPVDLGAEIAPPLFSALNSASYYSVYPPASQLVFLLGGWATSVWGWVVGWYVLKAAFLSLELAGVWALSRIVPARELVLYAWHPLVVIEVAGQAHTEAGMVGALFLSLWAYRRRRPIVSAAALTVAGWFKLYPLALIPFLLRRIGWRYAWVPLATTVLLLTPFAAPTALGHVMESLDLYVRSFEFNAGPYFALKEIGYALTGEDQSKVLGPALRALFVLGLGGLFFADARRPSSLAAVYLTVIGWLWVTATTVHPWYLLGVVALVPLVLAEREETAHSATPWLHAAAWLWLSVASLATYLFYTLGPTPYWIAVIVGWGGWAVLIVSAALFGALPTLMRRRARSKWEWVRTHAGLPHTLLDLGAGEGYVGEMAVLDTGAIVTLADVIDMNRSSLPLVRYDGASLPFADDAFDVTLLVFVLHHAQRPEAVLREAQRVTRGRVLVLESVYETESERRWLTFADRLANRLRSGGRMRDQEEHLGFRPVSDWRDTFRACGLHVEHQEQRGNRLHRQHLFVLSAE